MIDIKQNAPARGKEKDMDTVLTKEEIIEVIENIIEGAKTSAMVSNYPDTLLAIAQNCEIIVENLERIFEV